MLKVEAGVFSLLLGTALHLDWHLARPKHHRLSFGLPYHWLVTALIFAVVAWIIGRRWPAIRWQLGAFVFVTAIIIGQLLVPLGLSIFYDGRIGYDVSGEQWAAFGQTIAAAASTYWSALWLGSRARD